MTHTLCSLSVPPELQAWLPVDHWVGSECLPLVVFATSVPSCCRGACDCQQASSVGRLHCGWQSRACITLGTQIPWGHTSILCFPTASLSLLCFWPPSGWSVPGVVPLVTSPTFDTNVALMRETLYQKALYRKNNGYTLSLINAQLQHNTGLVVCHRIG